MRVNICGIPYTIVMCEDKFNADNFHFGQIEYGKGEIRINKGLSDEIQKETLCHEMVHGILVHLGYSEKSQDEQFVQALGNAIAQSFDILTLADHDLLKVSEEEKDAGDVVDD